MTPANNLIPRIAVLSRMAEILRDNPDLCIQYRGDLLYDAAIVGHDQGAFLWLPYHHGSHMLPLDGSRSPDLVNQIYRDFPGVQGYLIGASVDVVVAISQDEARALLEERLPLRTPQEALHLAVTRAKADGAASLT